MITVSLALADFLQDWYGWATGTQKPADADPYWLDMGLCANLQWCYKPKDTDPREIHDLNQEMKSIFLNEFGSEQYPFGEDAYNSIRNNAHEDRNRLAWIESKLLEVGVVAAPKWYRDFRIDFEYGEYTATHDNCEQEPDGEGGWQVTGMRTSSRTLVGLREEIDALLEEAK